MYLLGHLDTRNNFSSSRATPKALIEIFFSALKNDLWCLKQIAKYVVLYIDRI